MTDAPLGSGKSSRWAWAVVDLGAIRHNTNVLATMAAPAALWAVVKADGYGHGAVPVARTALASGASGLCVALVQEGMELRAAGIDAPILVLSEQPPEQSTDLVAADLIATVYERATVEALASAVRASGRVMPLPVHVKIDTGMHRVGAATRDAAAIVKAVRGCSELRLAGVFTHLAKADEPDDVATVAQLDEFDRVVASLALSNDVVVHAANSAGLLAHQRAHCSLVRAGIALYGLAPGPALRSAVNAGDRPFSAAVRPRPETDRNREPATSASASAVSLRPAFALRARVGFVKRVEAGDRISYGLRHEFGRATNVATIPIGYADGVPRRLFDCGGELLIGGRRRPIVGVVTMDQLMVDCGDDPVAVGDDVVLIGHQGDETITLDDWADSLGTINYELVCQISARVPRRYVGG